MTTTTCNYKRVYVWELPVRIFHWITAFSIVILVITGFIIADPPAINANVEATNSYWFGYIRAIHLITAVVLVASSVFRLYWSIVGNQFANWKNFIPYTKKGIQNILHVLRVDILLMGDRDHDLRNISIGHNYLAAFSYFLMGLLFILQVSTGFALMADTSSWWLPKMFSWVVPLFGGDILVRYIHHFSTWIFMAFAVIHIYLVLFHDYVEARGEASAMISGFKFVRLERFRVIKEKFEEIKGKIVAVESDEEH